MGMTADGHFEKESKRVGGPTRRHLAALRPSSQDVRYFDIEKVGCLKSEPRNSRLEPFPHFGPQQYLENG